MIRQLWYCVGWLFDPRLWGIDALYRFLSRPSFFEQQRCFVNHIALHPSIARNITRKARSDVDNSSIAVFSTPGPDGETRTHYVA